MFEALRCALKGHMFVDSRSQPGTEVCVRCHQRRRFEGLADALKDPGEAPRPD